MIIERVTKTLETIDTHFGSEKKKRVITKMFSAGGREKATGGISGSRNALGHGAHFKRGWRGGRRVRERKKKLGR